MEKLSDVSKYKATITVCGEHCEIFQSIPKLHGAQQMHRIVNLKHELQWIMYILNLEVKIL